jgi:hypothetical protein
MISPTRIPGTEPGYNGDPDRRRRAPCGVLQLVGCLPARMDRV